MLNCVEMESHGFKCVVYAAMFVKVLSILSSVHMTGFANAPVILLLLNSQNSLVPYQFANESKQCVHSRYLFYALF